MNDTRSALNPCLPCAAALRLGRVRILRNAEKLFIHVECVHVLIGVIKQNQTAKIEERKVVN